MPRAACIFDCHVPWVDKRALNLAIRVFQHYGLESKDELVIGGDFADFYNLARFAQSDQIEESIHDEIHEVNASLDLLDSKFPKAIKTYICGNHEQRLSKFLLEKCRQLFDLISMEKLFRLDDRGYKFIPYGPHQAHYALGSNIVVRHEPPACGENAAATSLKKGLESVIAGHTHRIQTSHSVSLSGRDISANISGGLMDKKAPVFNYVVGHNQWQLGFIILHESGTNVKSYFVETVFIDANYRCLAGGKVFLG